MKTIWTVIFGLLLWAAPAVAQGQYYAQYYTNADGGIFMYATNAGAVIIEGYEGPGNVTIPTNIVGLPVTSIDVPAFQGSSVTSVTIPGSVTSIGNYAFVDCASLTNLLLGYGITNIGEGAFDECNGLTLVTIPGSVTSFGGNAFSSCASLANVTLEEGITNIPDSEFAECSHLTSVSIPDSVMSIADGAFGACSSLPAVIIPDTVTYIGNLAFASCLSLTNVMIPASVTNIGPAFVSCTNLTAIMVDAENSFYASSHGVLFDKSQTTLIEYPGGLSGSYTIPASVTSIGWFAFSGSYGLTNISMPGDVSSIGVYAFADCAGLARVTISASVTNIEEGTFQDLSFTSVYFEGNPPSVGEYEFDGANNVTVYYSPGATGWDAFSAMNDVPAVLWNPLIQTGRASFGVSNNQFGFNITGTSNIPIVVQACTNLSNPVWSPLTNVLLTNGSFYFSDSQWTNFSGRYYRISAP